MKNILREIYDDEYDITPKRDKRQRELGKKLCAEWDKIQTMFGDDFVNRLFDLESEQEDWRDFHFFREGFRFGVRLMLEALGD